MKNLHSKEAIEELIDTNQMVLLYFGGSSCGVCVDMKPKIERLIRAYPEIQGVYIDVEKFHNIGISYEIFTIPGILFFVEGKETIREARHISITDIEKRILRYYNLLI